MSVRLGVQRWPAGIAGTTVRFTASAVRHLGWWLEWQARSRPGEACRPLEDAGMAAGGSLDDRAA